ncbi:hypothetical protein VTI74DRAFT_8472 [Chaetomium olivicolor]
MGSTTICPQAQGASWDTLPAFLRALCLSTPTMLSESDKDDDNWFDDPKKVEYVRQLIEAIYEARAIVASYNAVILLITLLMIFWHWRESTSNKRKWKQLIARPLGDDTGDGTTTPSAASTSSGIIPGTATPSGAAKDLDVERVPLLTGRGTMTSPRKRSTMSTAVRSWLERQPPPIPIINRTLPSNGTSLFVLAWLALNIFVHFFRLPLRWDFFFIFADRAGFIFIVNLPLLYLLSAKNQPLRQLTGYSYEALNIFHRRVGELICFEAAVHFVGMLVWQFVLAEDWLLASQTAYAYFTHPLILFGIGALASYELLFFTSLASFRQRWYELFLAIHVVLQILSLLFLWFHFYTSRPYVALALFIFLADRLLWRLILKRATIKADLNILDANTFQLTAQWEIPRAPKENHHPWWRWPPPFLRRQSILHGWDPTDHVFLTVPALGRTHALQAHPFTIASPAPGRPQSSSSSFPPPSSASSLQPPTSSPKPQAHGLAGGGGGRAGSGTGRRRSTKQAELTLLVRAQDGFTRELMLWSLTHFRRMSVALDGPYGSPHAMGVLRAAGCAVLVAGGSGIAVAFPLAWALLHEDEGEDDSGVERAVGVDGGRYIGVADEEVVGSAGAGMVKRRVHLLWVTHSREHRQWVCHFHLRELVKRGLDLVMPEPTAEAGRPDVKGIVSGWIEAAAAEGREVGIVVSGPDGLNRTVRNTCADAIGEGREVRVAVEKFGW